MTIEPVSVVPQGNNEVKNEMLKLKLFGSFLSSSAEKSSFLYETLFLHHRLHYNTILNEPDVEKLKVIQDNAKKLLAREENEQDSLSTCILNNIVGVINVIINPDDNDVLLKNYTVMKSEKHDVSNEFSALLQLENIYYTNSLTNLITDSSFKIPTLENSLVIAYLDKICNKITDCESIQSPFLKFYCKLQLQHIKDTEVLEFLKNMIADMKFPDAGAIDKDEKQKELDLYLQILLNFYDGFLVENLQVWEDIVTAIIRKTFHSSVVAGIAAKLERKFKNISKSEVFFNNYLVYNEKYFEFNNEYKDLVSTLKLATTLRDHKNVEVFLNKIYESFELTLITKKDSLLIFESDKFGLVTVPSFVNSIFVDAWRVLYEATDINKQMDEAFYYLSNILQLNLPSELKIKYEFEYAYNLALIKQNEKSCIWLKQKILSVKPDHNLKSWLLLAIVESSKEEKINALTISNSILGLLENQEESGEAIDIASLSFEERYYYIIFKFLQLDIISEMHGIKDSLDLLSDLFGLYELLFADYKNSKESIDSPRYTKEYVLQLVWIHSSKMYFLSGQKSEAFSCLQEISNMDVEFKNLNSLNMKGFLNNDISQFELVLGYEPANLIALNGLATILLSEDNNCSLEYKNQLSGLCLKIKTALDNSVQCQFNGQLHFNLSKLYMKLGYSNEQQKEILLTTIENLENDTILDPWIVKLI